MLHIYFTALVLQSWRTPVLGDLLSSVKTCYVSEWRGKLQKSAVQPGSFVLHLTQFKKGVRHIKQKLSVRSVFNSLAKLGKGLLASVMLRFHTEKNQYIGYCKSCCIFCQCPLTLQSLYLRLLYCRKTVQLDYNTAKAGRKGYLL